MTNANVWTYLQGLIAGNGPIRRLVPVDVREYYAARDLSALPLLLRMSGLAKAPLSVEVPFDGERGERLRAALSRSTRAEVAPASTAAPAVTPAAKAATPAASR